jgi:hypothetical protein
VQRFDQDSASCQIFTYKEGIFSSLAHDLRIVVTSFTVEVGGTDHFIKAVFDARSLRVDCAMENGRERPDLLSARERDDIYNRMIREVLHTETYPESVLLSSSVRKEGTDFLVSGTLSLQGQKREISFVVKRAEGERYVADVRLHLPDFGIAPYSALLGAIRVKADILIHIEIPADHIAEESL